MVSALCHGEPCFVVKRFSGSYNFCFQIRFEGGREDMLLRFPIHGTVMNPQKKVEDEAVCNYGKHAGLHSLPNEKSRRHTGRSSIPSKTLRLSKADCHC